MNVKRCLSRAAKAASAPMKKVVILASAFLGTNGTPFRKNVKVSDQLSRKLFRYLFASRWSILFQTSMNVTLPITHVTIMRSAAMCQELVHASVVLVMKATVITAKVR